MFIYYTENWRIVNKHIGNPACTSTDGLCGLMNCSWFFLCKVWDWSWPMWDKQVWCIHEVNSVLCPLLSHLVYIHLFIILGDHRIFGNCGKILDIGMENKTNNEKIKCCCPNLYMHLYTVCVAFCICHFPHVMICSNIYTTIIFVPQCLFWASCSSSSCRCMLEKKMTEKCKYFTIRWPTPMHNYYCLPVYLCSYQANGFPPFLDSNWQQLFV